MKKIFYSLFFLLLGFFVITGFNYIDLNKVINVKSKNKGYFDYKRKSDVISGSKLQLMIALFLSFFIFGWLYIGNKIFIFTALIPLWYIINKMRKKQK